MKNNFIPCAKWIKRGVAKSKPEGVQLSKEELKELVDKAKADILESAESIKNYKDAFESNTSASGGDQFNMETYDQDEDAECLTGIGNMISLDETDDTGQIEDDDEDSEKEDEEIKPDDNLIAVGHVYGDISVLEIYVFNEAANDLYVHHDTVLPTIPLCFEWLSFKPSQTTPANLLAMGGLTPEITVWDLDSLNSLEPIMKLGRFSDKKKYQHRNHGHKDAVLDLSWNTSLPHCLASGSVDRSVLLWDLHKAKAISEFNSFQEKVQAIEWHPSETNLLAAGDCSHTVQILDCRLVETLSLFTVNGEVERIAWSPGNQFNVLVGTSEGVICCADLRNHQPLWQVKAHDKEITGLCVDVSKPDSLVTCSADQTVKVWGSRGGGAEPSLVHTRPLRLGELQCLALCPDNPSLACVGGTARDNNFRVINLADYTPNTNSEEIESSTQEM